VQFGLSSQSGFQAREAQFSGQFELSQQSELHAAEAQLPEQFGVEAQLEREGWLLLWLSPEEATEGDESGFLGLNQNVIDKVGFFRAGAAYRDAYPNMLWHD